MVIANGVLHHTHDARRGFAEIVRKAKPGGLVLVGLPPRFGRAAVKGAPYGSGIPLDDVLGWFGENGVDYLNCTPAIAGSGGADAGLMTATEPGTATGRLMTELSWLATRVSQFVMTGRKR